MPKTTVTTTDRLAEIEAREKALPRSAWQQRATDAGRSRQIAITREPCIPLGGDAGLLCVPAPVWAERGLSAQTGLFAFAGSLAALALLALAAAGAFS
jgi:hypothetical protein